VAQQAIEPYPLQVTFRKTTNLVYPHAIRSVDRGSRDVLVQKAKGVENVLQLKAARPGFEETNLTVITGDGKLYSYKVNYAEEPVVLNLRFSQAVSAKADVFFSQEGTNEGLMEVYAAMVLGEERTQRGPRDRKFGIGLDLEGLFVKDDRMYYQLGLTNRTDIRYDIDQLRFYVRDKKIVKRTARQENEIKSLVEVGNAVAIEGRSGQQVVFVLPKFTIPDKKHLVVQLMEKDGGRHLKLKLGNRKLIRALVLPSVEGLKQSD
jgi:conjugative transposon TraN protein